jgi:hypothetical protein
MVAAASPLAIDFSGSKFYEASFLFKVDFARKLRDNDENHICALLMIETGYLYNLKGRFCGGVVLD